MKTQTDSDGDVQSGAAIGTVQQPRGFHETQPNWMVDGYGIRGPQRDAPAVSVRPEPMQFGVDNQNKGFGEGESGACRPTAPPPSGTYVWGAVNGVCQWINTTTC